MGMSVELSGGREEEDRMKFAGRDGAGRRAGYARPDWE